MPFDGSGNFISLGLPDFPAIGGQPIYATQFNNVIQDLMGGFASVLARDGQSSMTGDLQMGGNKITGVGAAVANGQLAAFGQSGLSFADLHLDGNLTLGSTVIAAGSLSVVKPAGAQDAFVDATVSAYARMAMGVNHSGAVSSIGTPDGGAYIGSLQGVDLYFGLSGAIKAVLRTTGMFELANTLKVAGAECFQMMGSNPYISAWANGVNRTGYIAFNAGGDISLVDEVGGGRIIMSNTAGAAYLDAAGHWRCDGGFIGNISGSAGSVPWTGVAGRPTNLSQFVNDVGAGGGVITFNGRGGAVGLISGDVTSALGYTPLSGISGGMVTAALGYTPYNNTNPSGFITGISGAMVTAALGFTPIQRSSISAANAISHTGTNNGTGERYLDTSLAYDSSTGVFTLTRIYVYNAADGGFGG